MKKQTKIVLVIVAIVAAVIIAGSFLLPKANSKLTHGTMGASGGSSMSKAEVQMRSDLVKDTIALKRLITSLVTFQKVNEKTSRQIDSCLLLFQYHPIMTDRAYNGPMIDLRDYSAYLKNQNASVAATQVMLEGFLNGREQDEKPLNIGQNLYGFGVFVQQVMASDTVLQIAAADIDRFIEKIQKKRKNFEDIPLEQFRNQLLVAKLMTTAMVGQNSSIAMLSKYAKTINTDNLVYKP